MWGALGGVAENLSRSVTKLAADVIESASEEIVGKPPAPAQGLAQEQAQAQAKAQAQAQVRADAAPEGSAVSSRLAALKARMLSDGSASPGRSHEAHKKDDGSGPSPVGLKSTSANCSVGSGDSQAGGRANDMAFFFQPPDVNGNRTQESDVQNGGFWGQRGGLVALEAVGNRGIAPTMSVASPMQTPGDTQEVRQLNESLSKLKGQMLGNAAAAEGEKKQVAHDYCMKIDELQKVVQGLRLELSEARAGTAAGTTTSASQQEVKESRAHSLALESELCKLRRQVMAESERAFKLEEELAQERQLHKSQESTSGRNQQNQQANLQESAQREAVLQAQVDELQQKLAAAKQQLSEQSTPVPGLEMSFEAQQRELSEAFGFAFPGVDATPQVHEVCSVEIQTDRVADEVEDRSGASCFWELQDERQSHAKTQAELARLQHLLQQSHSQQPGADAIADRDAFWIKELEQERQNSQDARQALQQQLEAALVSNDAAEAQGLQQRLEQEKGHSMQLQQHLSEKEEQVLQLDRDVEALQQALQERDRIWQAELVAGQSELRQVKQELEQAKAQDVQASAPFTIAEAQADSQNDPYKEVPTLKQELKQEKEGHEKAERRVIALQQQLDAKCQRLAADLAMLQDQLDEEKTMHAATQHKLSTVQQQAKHAFDNAAALQSQLADAVQLKAGLENALELSRKDLDCQSGKVADEVKKCDLIWKKEMKRLQLSYSELTVKYEQACLQAQQEGNLKEQERDRVRDAQQQLSTLRLDLDQKQADFEAAQHELQAAQATLVQLQNASAETASAGAAELERLLQQKMEECSKLAAENGRLQDESQKLRSQIHGLSLEKQRLEAGSEAHLAEVGTASADADRTKQQLNRLKKQMMQMQEDQESQLSWRVDAEVKLALEEHKKQEASVVAKLSKELTDVQSALEVAVTRSKQWEKENSEWRDASTQKDKEISNLHTALGELTYQSEAADNLRRSLNQSKAEVDSLRLELQNAQASMHEAQSSRRAAENAADMAQKSLQKLEDKARAVREENIRLKRALEESVRKITDINQNSDSMVDRRVVVKLLVTYIERRNSRDVLALMSRMLGFTEEEQKRVGLRGARRGILGAVAGPFALMGRALGGGDSAAPGGSIADQWVEFLLKQVDDERSNSALYSLPEDSPSDPPSSLSPALYDDPMAHRRTNSAELEETPHSMNLDELPGRGGRSGPISDPGWHHSLAAPLPTSLERLNPGSAGLGTGVGATSSTGLGQQATPGGVEGVDWGRMGPASSSGSASPGLLPVGYSASQYSAPLYSTQNVPAAAPPVLGHFDSRATGAGTGVGGTVGAPRPVAVSPAGSGGDPPWVTTPWRAPSTHAPGQVSNAPSLAVQGGFVPQGQTASLSSGLQGPSLKQYMQQYSQRMG